MPTSGARRIALGTAQFGLDYGITNRSGKVAPGEVEGILRAAYAAGVGLVDTAPLYGESERALGTAGVAEFRVVSKTPKFGGFHDAAEAAEALEQSLRDSLRRLGTRALYGVLFHDPADLSGPLGAPLWRRLEQLKALGLVSKIGVSIYTGEELDLLLEQFPLDIVQIPFNAIDRRLEEGGQLARLTERGVETHARSIFLQGLLLMEAAEIPARFAGLSQAVAAFQRACTDRGLSRQEGLLAAVMRQSVVSHLVCGVTSVDELRALVAAAERAAAVENFRVPALPEVDERVLNPARWAELG